MLAYQAVWLRGPDAAPRAEEVAALAWLGAETTAAVALRGAVGFRE